MRGILIVNHALNGEKYSEQNRLYVDAANNLGIDLSIKTNADVRPFDSDFVLFLDKDILYARLLEQDGMRVFNSARSIALCDDKAMTYLALRKAGISMPQTLVVPMTYFKTDWTDNPFVAYAAGILGFPMIVKEACGSFGWQVWMVNNTQELIGQLNQCSPKRVILQKYISSSHGRDVRINVVGGKAVASMYRYSDTDFRANISSGGSMKPYCPNEKQIAVAVRACDALGLDFGGVDLLFGEQEEPILCEVNSNAHIKNILTCTGINVAESILAHIAHEVNKA